MTIGELKDSSTMVWVLKVFGRLTERFVDTRQCICLVRDKLNLSQESYMGQVRFIEDLFGIAA